MFLCAKNILALVLLVAPLVTAHGKVSLATGDQGGNGTALGSKSSSDAIQGAVVPGAGSNKVTEVDTTVFQGKQKAGCGKTQKGANKIDSGTKQAMLLSGNTLPQVSMGGFVSGIVHIVTSDGAGPYKALLDTTGTGDFTHAIVMNVTTQVPGKNGNIKKAKNTRSLGSIGNIYKRASNINEDHEFKITMPGNVSCTGTVANQTNVCMVKLVNPSNAGPFGGCVPIQMVGANTTATQKVKRRFNS